MAVQKTLFGMALGLGALSVAQGQSLQEQQAQIFQRDIHPILQESCYPCHGANKQEANLRLDSPEAARQGGLSGEPAVVPGDALASRLVRAITLPPEHVQAMPPASNPRLTNDEAMALIHWINRGAAWPEEGPAQAAVEAPAESAAPTAPAEATETVSFAEHIAPILEASCFECHSDKRQKGDLRLDIEEAVLEGGLSGPAVVPGKIDESLLLQRILLPADHPDFMPSNGDPLTAEQIALIRDWIASGAAFDAAGQQFAEAEQETPPGADLKALAEGVPAADEAALAQLRDAGVIVMALGEENPLVRADFSLLGEAANDDMLDLLQPLKEQLTWIDLRGAGVTDAGAAKLAGFGKLTRLNLAQTGVGSGIAEHLKQMPHLEYLNLYATKVDDAVLTPLAELPALRRLFVWQTGVTKEAAAELAAHHPELQVDTGSELAAAPVSPPPLPEVAFALFEDAESCCAKARAEGKACDHACCIEAAEAGEVCGKCNAMAVASMTLAAGFSEGSCCAKALAEGKWCEHPCCVEARKTNTVCTKCNGAAAQEDAA